MLYSRTGVRSHDPIFVKRRGIVDVVDGFPTGMVDEKGRCRAGCCDATEKEAARASLEMLRVGGGPAETDGARLATRRGIEVLFDPVRSVEPADKVELICELYETNDCLGRCISFFLVCFFQGMTTKYLHQDVDKHFNTPIAKMSTTLRW
jgi:hypothetical protein